MNLELAIGIALTAHEGQVDKAGAPYILHSLRVMMAQKTEIAKVVAVLHDVVEDTHWTFDGLIDRGLTDRQYEALKALTHRDGEPYVDYIERVAKNAIARRVKLADLEDNMDWTRIKTRTEKDWARMAKYASAHDYLRMVTQ